MSWGPYGPYAPPPYYGPPQQPGLSYIPVPPGTSADDAIRLIERIERRTRKRAEKTKKEEEEKKKKDKPKPQEVPKISLGTSFLLMLTFGLPVGALELWALEAIKAMIAR